nr:hypothetical protein [uncultured Actinotalea sp.]
MPPTVTGRHRHRGGTTMGMFSGLIKGALLSKLIGRFGRSRGRRY